MIKNIHAFRNTLESLKNICQIHKKHKMQESCPEKKQKRNDYSQNTKPPESLTTNPDLKNSSINYQSQKFGIDETKKT